MSDQILSPGPIGRIQRSLQIKILVLVAVIAVTLLSLMLWRTNALLMQEKTAFINDSAMKQIAPLKRLVQQRLSDEKNALVAFASVRVNQKSPNDSNSATSSDFGNFDVISLVQPGAGAPWAPTWIDRRPDAREDRWPEGFDQTLLKNINYSRAKDGETTWIRVSDRQGAPIYAVMITVELRSQAAAKEASGSSTKALPDTAERALTTMQLANKAVLVGFTSVSPFTDVTEDFIGSTSSVYIVDDRGFVASHVNRAYQGALFTEDPLVRDILKGKRSGATGRFEDLDSRPVLGHYEKIEHSNLFAIIATPEQVINSVVGSERNSMYQIGLVSLLFAMAAGAIGSWLITRSTAPATDFSTGDSLIPPAPQPLAASSAPVSVAASPVKSRILTDGITKLLNEPLHGILGHASLIRAKAADDDLAGHADSITREARGLRERIERIRNWEEASETTRNESPIDLTELINAEIERREIEFENGGIHITRELKPVPEINGDRQSLTQAITNLVDNAVEALASHPAKRLRFETDYRDNQIVLLITDTGIGMARETRDRAFEPFYKSFESATIGASNHLGLGLSAVAETVKNLGGEWKIDSVPGEGSTFTFRFPVEAAMADAFNAKEAKKLEASLANTEGSKVEVTPVEVPAANTEMTREASAIEAAPPEPASTIETVAPISDELFAPRIREEIIEIETHEAADLFDTDFGEPLAIPIHVAVNADTATPTTIDKDHDEPSAGPLMLDELDDDDEIFANVPLSKATNRLTKVGQLPTPAPSAHVPSVSAKRRAPEPFEVKIRKPQKRRPAASRSERPPNTGPEKGME